MDSASQSDDKGREALDRIGEVVKVLKGLPRGIERRGIGYGWELYDQVEPDLDEALSFIEKIPEQGQKIVHLIYLLREIAILSRPGKE
jgi:hypothetical protein